MLEEKCRFNAYWSLETIIIIPDFVPSVVRAPTYLGSATTGIYAGVSPSACFTISNTNEPATLRYITRDNGGDTPVYGHCAIAATASTLG